MQKDEDVRRYWIFQGMPDRYDLAEKLVPGESEPWTLGHSQREVKPGDVVYFWRGGRQSGLYGWGIVTHPPYTEDSATTKKGPQWRVNVEYQARFQNPIFKKEIGSSRQGGLLAGLIILRAPQGANFKVTMNEAINLNQLIRDRSDKAPEDPVGTELSRFPVESLAPLSLGRSATLIVGAGLRFAQITDRDQLDGEVLISVLLATAVSGKGWPRGTMPFLGKIFSAMDVEKVYLEALEHPILSPPEAVDYFVSDEVLDILESARLMAIFSTAKEEIGVRHLLAGLLLTCKDLNLELLEGYASSVGISLRDLVLQFIKYTVSEFADDDSSAWMSQFRSGIDARLDAFENLDFQKAASEKISRSDLTSENFTEKADVPLEQPVQLPEVKAQAVSTALQVAFSGRPVPDRPFGADLLRIESEVNALAHLFALQDEDNAETGDTGRSTFALGLFGRWGSGKSFFIEKLKKKIDHLRKSGGDGETRYCKEIIQIDFNAWHYNEANIWASLVHHMFDTLQKHFQEKDKEEEFKNLIKELEISQERREQLDKKIDKKQTQKQGIEEKILEQEKKIESFIGDQLKNIIELPGRIAANQAAQEKLLVLLPRAAGVLGLPTGHLKSNLEEGKQSATEIINILNESGAMVGRSQAVGRSLLRSGFSPAFLVIAAVVLVIYFAVPLWVVNPNLWNDLISVPGQFIALVTPMLVWFKSRLANASYLSDEIGGIEAELRKDIRNEQEEKNKLLVGLRAEQERISAEITDARKKKDLLDQEILDFQSKLDDLGSAESLVDYINDRAASDDYRSQLGILALIRRDFEKLSRLMTKSNWHSTVSMSESESAARLPHIDRIILYIDDLDRVQDSKKVLQVLEAVHLLLAFPLFHVVVAVDERWAARSVLSHHGEFFGIKKVGNNDSDNIPMQEKAFLLELIGAQPATPREFLEKIFQISFWVRPLTEQLTADLIQGVVTKNYQLSAQIAEDRDNILSRVEVGEASLSAAEPGFSNSVQENAPESEVVAEDVTLAATDSEGESDVETDTNAPDDSQENVVAEETSASSERINFEITEEELISMRALASVVGRSPRTVKRFINTYRLFKAMDIPPGVGGWTDEESTEFDIVEYHVPIMILLSIQVGHPDIAVRFFEHVDNALNQNDSQELGSLLNEWKDDKPENEGESKKWLSTLYALSDVQDLYGDKPRLRDLTVNAFNPWLLATSRFGFKEWVRGGEL